MKPQYGIWCTPPSDDRRSKPGWLGVPGGAPDVFDTRREAAAFIHKTKSNTPDWTYTPKRMDSK